MCLSNSDPGALLACLESLRKALHSFSPLPDPPQQESAQTVINLGNAPQMKLYAK